MAEAAVKENRAAEAAQELTDGFHLVIDALKLNGIDTIYGVPGIPITDFGRNNARRNSPNFLRQRKVRRKHYASQ